MYYLQSRYYNPETGRFLNADGLITTSQGLLDNNLFAYCGGDPINRIDSTGRGWLENKWNGFWQRVKSWSSDKKEKVKNNNNITITKGITASASMGAGVSTSLGATVDTKGNIGMSITVNGGGGFPSAGIGEFISANNAPTIFEQGGLGATVGVSGGPWVVAPGVDYNMLINQENDCVYHGGTLSVSYGLYPTLVEVHGEVGYTWVWGLNIFDIAIDVADFMLTE